VCVAATVCSPAWPANDNVCGFTRCADWYYIDCVEHCVVVLVLLLMMLVLLMIGIVIDDDVDC
jgi:uncharacterized membrane protein YhdT